jgi:hypothetical protein
MKIFFIAAQKSRKERNEKEKLKSLIIIILSNGIYAKRRVKAKEEGEKHFHYFPSCSLSSSKFFPEINMKLSEQFIIATFIFL